jgi:hypothetical protein
MPRLSKMQILQNTAIAKLNTNFKKGLINSRTYNAIYNKIGFSNRKDTINKIINLQDKLELFKSNEERSGRKVKNLTAPQIKKLRD